MLRLDIVKTIYFNFKYFPFKQAIRLPFYIYRHTLLARTEGKIILNCPAKRGLVKIGIRKLGTADIKYERAVLEICGTLILNGEAKFGLGSKISVGKDGVLTLGNHFMCTGSSSIICHKQVTFGDDCLLSWEILIMDTDFHSILDNQGRIINELKPISIGNHVWIGCRNTILKGVSIPDNTVIAANSTITKSFIEQHVVIGGNGENQRILKSDVNWSLTDPNQ